MKFKGLEITHGIDFCGDCGRSFIRGEGFTEHLSTCKKRGPMCYIWFNNHKHLKPCHPSLGSSEFNGDFLRWNEANRALCVNINE